MISESKRIKFHNKLKDILGNNNVYYNPPPDEKIKYPCIIYNIKDINTNKSDNKVYLLSHVYNAILIGVKPYNDIKDKILINIPYSSFDRSYIQDNLYHYAYTIYEN